MSLGRCLPDWPVHINHAGKQVLARDKEHILTREREDTEREREKETNRERSRREKEREKEIDRERSRREREREKEINRERSRREQCILMHSKSHFNPLNREFKEYLNFLRNCVS